MENKIKSNVSAVEVNYEIIKSKDNGEDKPTENVVVLSHLSDNESNVTISDTFTEVKYDCVKEAGSEAMRQLESTYEVISELSKLRQESKQSNWRVSSVARELKELIKVMSTYTI